MELGVDFPFKGGKSVNWKTKERGKKMINQGKWKELGLNGYSSLEREIPAKTNFLAENPLYKILKTGVPVQPLFIREGYIYLRNGFTLCWGIRWSCGAVSHTWTSNQKI